jgi:hypothetical protein
VIVILNHNQDKTREQGIDVPLEAEICEFQTALQFHHAFLVSSASGDLLVLESLYQDTSMEKSQTTL